MPLARLSSRLRIGFGLALALLTPSALFAGHSAGGQFPLADQGVLRLQLGSVDRFLWDHPTNSDVVQGIFDKRDLTGRSQDKCLLALGTPTLVAASATGGSPGFAFDGLGVFGGGSGSNARGVDCSRIGAGESLTFALAGSLAGYQVHHTELDIEVKQNARIRATTMLGGQVAGVFELRSGGSIVSGQGSSAPGSAIFNCNAASDSGSDSGSSDNCRWVPPDGLWDSIKLERLNGEFSLEGGADFGSNAFPNNSLFFLTKAAGILDCGDPTISVGDGLTAAQVTGRRLDNADGANCILIPYALESTGNSVTFLADTRNQTSAAHVFVITWPPSGASSLLDIPLAQQTFNGVDFFDLDLCVGTPIYDGDGNLIALDGTLPDLDPNSPDIQYGCVVEEKDKYVDEDTIQIQHTIYLRGDWKVILNQ